MRAAVCMYACMLQQGSKNEKFLPKFGISNGLFGSAINVVNDLVNAPAAEARVSPRELAT
jgi:hypothetical protein